MKITKFLVLILVLIAFYGCASSGTVSSDTEFESHETGTSVKLRKPSPAKKEVLFYQRTRPRTIGEKATVVLKETGKEAIKGAVTGGAVGAVVGAATGKKTETPVVGGIAGAAIGAGKGFSSGLKKAQEPVTEKKTEVRVFSGFEGLRMVFPRRNVPYVMRTWIAPWRDEKDRLRWSRYVFTDLSVNRWNLGEKAEVISRKELLKLLSTVSEGRVQYLRGPKGMRRPRISFRQTKPQ